MSRRKTTEEFVAEALLIHNGKYSYEDTDYKGAHLKVIVSCKEHGPFRVTPDLHRRGADCPHCAAEVLGLNRRYTVDTMVAAFREQHQDTYDYSLITENPSDKGYVPVICKKHSVFMVSPSNHKKGRGCPKCQRNGYNKGKFGTFYILTSESTVKVGITNRDVEFRVKSVSKSSGEAFTTYTTFGFEDGAVAYAVEKYALSWLKQTYRPVDKVYDGSTECFTDVDLQALTDFVINVLPIQAAKTAYK